MAFWEEKSLKQMTQAEWESLCDHCGKCCLLKLEDADDEAQSVYYTNVVCDLFNQQNGHCTDYQQREERVPSCVKLTQDNLEQLAWMPPGCAYRRLMEGRGLPQWHHLVSGDKNTIHETDHSVLNKVVLEKNVAEDEWEEHIVVWPLQD